ncbi:MAG: hypothetical protein RIM33_16935 [Alphaproteobacteria bacterium]
MRDRWGFVGLCVRAQSDIRRPGKIRHAVKVPFERVQLDYKCRGIDFRNRVSDFGGATRRHVVSPFFSHKNPMSPAAAHQANRYQSTIMRFSSHRMVFPGRQTILMDFQPDQKNEGILRAIIPQRLRLSGRTFPKNAPRITICNQFR